MIDNYLRLSDIVAYVRAYKLSNYVWQIVISWDYFAKKTVGDQFVRAVDSISANIAEGFGRYYKKDKVLFYRYSFATTKESLDWNQKSFVRKLLSDEQYAYIFKELFELPKDIHHLINFTNDKLKI